MYCRRRDDGHIYCHLVFLIVLSLTLSKTIGHWVENNIIGPTCAGNIVEYSNIPDYDQQVKECDHEVKHCRPLCILSKLGMMNTEGYFIPTKSKSALQALLPPMKNSFRATELTGAYESCSMSFNFNDNLGVKNNCLSYAPLFDCFRKSTLMICEGVKGQEIDSEIGNAADPWPKSFIKPGDTNTVHRKNPPPPFVFTPGGASASNQQPQQQQLEGPVAPSKPQAPQMSPPSPPPQYYGQQQHTPPRQPQQVQMIPRYGYGQQQQAPARRPLPPLQQNVGQYPLPSNPSNIPPQYYYGYGQPQLRQMQPSLRHPGQGQGNLRQPYPARQTYNNMGPWGSSTSGIPPPQRQQIRYPQQQQLRGPYITSYQPPLPSNQYGYQQPRQQWSPPPTQQGPSSYGYQNNGGSLVVASPQPQQRPPPQLQPPQRSSYSSYSGGPGPINYVPSYYSTPTIQQGSQGLSQPQPTIRG